MGVAPSGNLGLPGPLLPRKPARKCALSPLYGLNGSPRESRSSHLFLHLLPVRLLSAANWGGGVCAYLQGPGLVRTQPLPPPVRPSPWGLHGDSRCLPTSAGQAGRRIRLEVLDFLSIFPPCPFPCYGVNLALSTISSSFSSLNPSSPPCSLPSLWTYGALRSFLEFCEETPLMILSHTDHSYGA